MASSTLAFSDSSFDSSSYSNYRPTYGPALFEQLYAYHRGGKDVAVDIGCGTGQITSILASTFRRVYGLDTSAKMLTQATKRDNITYEVSSAESIPSLPDGSVDLITVGQAAHWFDHAAWFREMARIMKPDATLSFWSYNEAEFSESERASKIWNRYSHAQDKLGPYWPQPGRSILESAMDGVDPPESLFVDIERHYTAQRQSKETQSPVRKEMMLSAAESYFRTSSAYHGWRVAHPDAISKRENGAGDVIDEMMDEICRATGWTSQTVVKVHWPTVAVLARKA